MALLESLLGSREALIFGSLAVVSAISLIGVVTLALRAIVLEDIVIHLVAFAAGALIGDTFLHLLPEATEAHGFTVEVSLAVLLGVVVFFTLERAIHWNHLHGTPHHAVHGHADPHAGADPHNPAKRPHVEPVVPSGALAHVLAETPARLHVHGESHPEAALLAAATGSAAGPASGRRVAPFVWTVLVGDGLHNFIDGAIVAAAFLIDVPVGVATALAVGLHEIPQEIGDFGVLVHGGLSKGTALGLNLASALTAFLGAALVLLATQAVAALETFLVPLAAGGFLYIAAADLIPQLHQERRTGHSLGQFLLFLAGIGAMYALRFLEAGA